MDWHKRLHRIINKFHDRWHANLSHRLDAVSQELNRLRRELAVARAESEDRREVLQRLVSDGVEQVLSRRLAEHARDLQDHLQLHAASIVAQVSESAAESEARRAALECARIEALEQLLSRRFAEQTSDLQSHLQLHAASIVAQVGERAAAHGEVDATTLPFSRVPVSARAA